MIFLLYDFKIVYVVFSLDCLSSKKKGFNGSFLKDTSNFVYKKDKVYYFLIRTLNEHL